MAGVRLSSAALLVALLGFGLGCKGMSALRPTAGEPASLAQLAQSTWRAQEIEGQPVSDELPQPVLVFEDRTRVSGTGGCNLFSGPVKGESAGVTFGPLAVTRRACAPALMDQEQRFFAALAKKANLQRDLDLLFLLAEDGSVTLRFSQDFPLDRDSSP